MIILDPMLDFVFRGLATQIYLLPLVV